MRETREDWHRKSHLFPAMPESEPQSASTVAGQGARVQLSDSSCSDRTRPSADASRSRAKLAASSEAGASEGVRPACRIRIAVYPPPRTVQRPSDAQDKHEHEHAHSDGLPGQRASSLVEELVQNPGLG
eukprot:6207209-Pleurochrysis_carterae.AAC.1